MPVLVATVGIAQGWTAFAEVAPSAVLIGLLAGTPERRRPRFTLSALAELPVWVSRCARTCALVAVVALITGELGHLRVALALSACVLVARSAAFVAWRWGRRRGRFVERLVVVGTACEAHELAAALERFPEHGAVAVGLVGPATAADPGLGGPPRLGPIGALADVLQAEAATRVVVVPDALEEDELDLIVAAAARRGAEVHIALRFAEALTIGCGGADHVRSVPMAWVPRRWTRPDQLFVKRLVDVLAVSVALVVFAPLFAVLALAVRLSGPGPILFRQPRVGRRGTMIEVAKFRSMIENDDADVTWSVSSDARVTLVGRWLRATSLDELPQLLAVAKGDMSLVGARPERPFFVERFEKSHRRYQQRHRMRVGLTGWAQVHDLRGDTSIADRTRFDNFYADHWTIWSDVVVLVRTVSAVVRHGRNSV